MIATGYCSELSSCLSAQLRAAELTNLGAMDVIGPSCDIDGYYSLVQCTWGNSQNCYCESKNGKFSRFANRNNIGNRIKDRDKNAM